MVLTALLNLIYPPPPSQFVTAMSVVSVASLAIVGLSEIRGVHLRYSKFANTNPDKGKKEKKKDSAADGSGEVVVTSKIGMLVLYTPAFLVGVASLFVFPHEGGLRFSLVRSAITLHFFKRIVEVLFIHKFSGAMAVDSMALISLSYSLSTATLIYSQHLSLGLPEPPINLVYPGVMLYLIGLGGNLYHHILLSKLREGGKKEYKIPKGGLFGWVICPHYLFEIIDFVGISFMSQTLYSCSFSLGTIFYLAGRSYVTRRWYTSKFEDFPDSVRALIPYIF